MRKIFYITLLAGALLSCKKEKLPTESQLDSTKPTLNSVDQWIFDNYTNPFNISVRYRWEEGDMSDLGRYNIPADSEKTKLVLDLFKKMWIDSYTEIGGVDFIKKISPREFVFRGGADKTPNGGSGAWGQASAGTTITIFDVNTVTATGLKNLTTLQGFSGLIHHEYTHILNQTRSFDEDAFQKITPEGYTAEWSNIADATSRRVGFVSSYARMNIGEDFAEMVKFMLTRTRTEWDAFVNGIVDAGGSTTATKARADIRKKEAIVVDYFNKSYGIDIYKLQATTAKNAVLYAQ
jgi:substrate import-associated zinc metallohydrolase lipoprotein